MASSSRSLTLMTQWEKKAHDASYPNPAAREQLQNLRCPLPQWTVHSDWVVQEQLLWVKSCFSLSNVARAAELHWNMCLGEVRAVSLDQSTTALTFTRSAFICPLSTVKPKKDTVSMRHIFLPLHRCIGWPDRHVSHAPAGALGKSVYHQGTQTQND